MMYVSPPFILIGYALKWVFRWPYFSSLAVHLSLTFIVGLGACSTVSVYSSLPLGALPKPMSGNTMISYSLVSLGVNVVRNSPGLPNGGCNTGGLGWNTGLTFTPG